MTAENLDIESLMNNRRHAVEQSLRLLSPAELEQLQHTLFDNDPTHPWAEPFHHFSDENRGSLFYHAIAGEQIQAVYCREKERGIWFNPGVAIGILQPMALAALKEIVDERGV